jgi:hypothetical protein
MFKTAHLKPNRNGEVMTIEERISRIYKIIDWLYKKIDVLRARVKINDEAYKVIGIDSLGSNSGKKYRKPVKVVIVEKI